MTNNSSKRIQDPIFFRKSGGWKSVSVHSIENIEAKAYKCELYFDNSTSIEIDMPMGEVLRKIKSESFIKVHRSFVINIEYVNMYYNNVFCMVSGKEIPIGRQYRDDVRKTLILIDKRDRGKSQIENIIA